MLFLLVSVGLTTTGCKCFWTPPAFVKYCLGLSISGKSPIALHLVQSLTFTFPHAARARLRPAQKWILRQDDVPYKTSSAHK